MTSLLTSVREDAEVRRASDDAQLDTGSAFQEAYDRALLRAAVREIAKRVREKADINPATPRGQGFQSGLMSAADFIEGSLE